MIYWCPQSQKLVFIDKKANPEFWDERWKKEETSKKLTRARKSRFWNSMVRRYFPRAGARILEGGCGDGHLVDALSYWGYDAYGIDFAKDTIDTIKQIAPSLKVEYGDVRDLNYPDGFFDGYCSLGVIEHFWGGYEQIISEMARVLKSGGIAFVTFPCISVLDKIKLAFKRYPKLESNSQPENFYQFALSADSVIKEFQKHNLAFVKKQQRGGLLGLKRSVTVLQKQIGWLESQSKKNSLYKYIVYTLTFALAPFCGHTCFCVFEKKQI